MIKDSNMVVPNYIVKGNTIKSAIKYNMPISEFYKLVDGEIGFSDDITRKIVTKFIKQEYGIDLPEKNYSNCRHYLKLKCLSGKDKVDTSQIAEKSREETRDLVTDLKIRNLDVLMEGVPTC